MYIRGFTMDDYAVVYGLWHNAGPGISLRPSDQPEEVERKLSRDPDLFLVAEEDGRVVGVVMGGWDGRRGWVHHLAVDPAHRRRGIGTALLMELEARLKAKGCLKANVLVHRDNKAASCLYKRMGYQEMTPIISMGKEL